MNTRLFLEYDVEYLPLPFQKVLKQLMTKKVGKYFPTISFITYNQKKIFENYCKSDTTHRYYRLNVTYKFIKDKNKLPYILYLSKSKNEENLQAIRDRKKTHTIIFSGSHFDKVCKKTVENNYKFEVLLSNIYGFDNDMLKEPTEDYSITLPNFKWQNKSKKDEKIVSIGGKQDLKQTVMKDNIPSNNPSFNLNIPTPSPVENKKPRKKVTIKTKTPPLIPPKKPRKKVNIFDYNLPLLPKKFNPKKHDRKNSEVPVFTIPEETRPYSKSNKLPPLLIPKRRPVTFDLKKDDLLVAQDLFLNSLYPKKTPPSLNGLNILKNILKSLKIRRILGISLTPDLEEKIENLDDETAFGLAKILSSLIKVSNRKNTIYSINKNQLKQIIEGFITTLLVLLNPE